MGKKQMYKEKDKNGKERYRVMSEHANDVVSDFKAMALKYNGIQIMEYADYQAQYQAEAEAEGQAEAEAEAGYYAAQAEAEAQASAE